LIVRQRGVGVLQEGDGNCRSISTVSKK
jgi:hypothetical protein